MDKDIRRIVDLPIEYRGFSVPDRFFVGYGLDLDGSLRNLPYIATLQERVWKEPFQVRRALVDFEHYIRDIPDFPKEGIVFKDITPLLASPKGFCGVIDAIAEAYEGSGVTKIIGAEARGFILGGALAYRLKAGFVPARKPGSCHGQQTLHV